jgi:Mn2+/Fe2+ NRAMP family transporter
MRVPVYTTDTRTFEVQSTIGIGDRNSQGATTEDVEVQHVQHIDMSNGWIVSILGWAIWFIIAGLNVYLIVMLGLRN